MNPITEGILKAIKFLAARRPKEAKRVKGKRYSIEHWGTAVHLRRSYSTLSPEDRMHYDAGELGKIKQSKLTLVPVYEAILQDQSRYTGEALREIAKRDPAQRRECQRRVRQMQSRSNKSLQKEAV